MLADVLQEGAKQGSRVEKHQVGCQACGDLVVTEEEKVNCLRHLGGDTTHLPVLEVPLLLGVGEEKVVALIQKTKQTKKQKLSK